MVMALAVEELFQSQDTLLVMFIHKKLLVHFNIELMQSLIFLQNKYCNDAAVTIAVHRYAASET